MIRSWWGVGQGSNLQGGRDAPGARKAPAANQFRHRLIERSAQERFVL